MDGVNDDQNDISKTILLATPKAIVLVSKVFYDDDSNDNDDNDDDDENDKDDGNNDDNDDSNDEDDTFGEDTGESAPLFDKLVKLRSEAKGDLSSITILYSNSGQHL